MLAYNVPYFQEGDIQTFLTSVARVNGRIRKVCAHDLLRTDR